MSALLMRLNVFGVKLSGIARMKDELEPRFRSIIYVKVMRMKMQIKRKKLPLFVHIYLGTINFYLCIKTHTFNLKEWKLERRQAA